MEVIGKLVKKLEIEKGISKAQKEWQKQSIVIDTEAQFNPLICISFFGDEKIGLLKGLKQGDEIEVGINISSREFEGKYYTQVDGWKVNKTTETEAPKIDSAPPEDDDLPF